MSHLPLTPDPAHAVRHPEPRGDDVFAQIRHALAATPLLGFDMGSTAVVGQTGIEGRVWVRAGLTAQAAAVRDGRDSGPRTRTWTLTTLDAATFAIVMRCDAMRGASMFADAFALAAQDAERRVEAVHAWSGRIRPTEDVE